MTCALIPTIPTSVPSLMTCARMRAVISCRNCRKIRNLLCIFLLSLGLLIPTSLPTSPAGWEWGDSGLGATPLAAERTSQACSNGEGRRWRAARALSLCDHYACRGECHRASGRAQQSSMSINPRACMGLRKCPIPRDLAGPSGGYPPWAVGFADPAIYSYVLWPQAVVHVTGAGRFGSDRQASHGA